MSKQRGCMCPFIWSFVCPPHPPPPKNHTRTHTQLTPPHPTSGVKCYSLLIVTVANHLSFCSNCFQGNREIWLPGTKSSTCDCYLFNSIFIYLFILKASTHTRTHTRTRMHTQTHVVPLDLDLTPLRADIVCFHFFYSFRTRVHVNARARTNTSLPLIN